MEINGDKPALYAQYIKAEAEKLVKVAALYGVVLTIEQKPRAPLAMGNYETVVAVRPGHPDALRIARRPDPAHGAPKPAGHNPVA